jgi:hypothetical protein
MADVFVMGVLGIVAFFFAATGLFALARPRAFGGSLGLVLDGASGANEVRAKYGGFFLLTGLLAAAALAGLSPRPWALIAIVVVFGGLIFGRLISLALDGGFKQYRGAIPALFVIDSCGFVLALLALAFEMTWL